MAAGDVHSTTVCERLSDTESIECSPAPSGRQLEELPFVGKVVADNVKRDLMTARRKYSSLKQFELEPFSNAGPWPDAWAPRAPPLIPSGATSTPSTGESSSSQLSGARRNDGGEDDGDKEEEQDESDDIDNDSDDDDEDDDEMKSQILHTARGIT